MNIVNSSKNTVIRFQSELVHYFQDLISKDPEIHWIAPSGSSSSSRPIGIKLDGNISHFLPLYELKPSLTWLKSRKESLKGQRLLLIVPCLSTRVFDYCKENGIAAVDLNGRTWLRAPGLLVDRSTLPGRSFRYELGPRNIFVGKSARIVRCLLTDRNRLWKQSEIVPRAKASPGLVSRIVQHLISLDCVEKVNAREFRLRSPSPLLDIWGESDSFIGRTFTKSYAGLLGDPLDLARRFQEAIQKASISIAFTQWIAAWLRYPFVEPPLVSAYVSRLPDAVTLGKLGLREVTEGGKLWLHVPEDDGIFIETQNRKGLALTTDAQIYIDLQDFGLRGPEAAEALRGWEGFCKP